MSTEKKGENNCDEEFLSNPAKEEQSGISETNSQHVVGEDEIRKCVCPGYD